MADNTLQIDIKTTADTSGLDQVKAKMAELQKGFLAPLPGGLFGIDEPIQQAVKSTEQLSSGMSLTGASINKARGEATVLAREIATGSVNARTLGALLGSLGMPLTIAAIAGIGVVKAIDAIAESTLKATKEQLAFQTALGKSVQEWAEMAKFATTLGDGVKLSDKIGKDLDKLSEEMQSFRTKEFQAWQNFWDLIARGLSNPTGSLPTFSGSNQDNLAKKQAELNEVVKAGNIELSAEQQSTQKWAEAVANLQTSIPEYAQRVSELTAQLNKYNAEAAKDPTNKGVLDARKQTLKDLQETTKQYDILVKDQVELNNQVKKEDRKDVVATLREEQTILQGIREQSQLVQQNPFLGADAKSAFSLQNYLREIQQLQAEISKLNALKAGPLDPAQLQQVDQRLQQANFELDLMQLKIVGLQQPLRTELASWVNGWGTAIHQVGDLISGTINSSLQGVNTLLTDAIFRTGDWRQTLQGVESQIISLFLTFIEHLALQKAAQLLGITTTTSAVVGSNVSIAASSAPAAAGTSIASYGSSALVGESTALAAIAAIEGALVAHEGGPVGALKRFHAGGLAPDEVPIIAQMGEVMIQRDVAQQPGMTDFLLGLNAGHFHQGGMIPRFHDGGWLGNPMTYGPGSPNATSSDRRQFFGSYDNRLQAGDIAVAPGSGIKPGPNSYVFINGQWWHVADYSYYSPGHPTPPGTWEVYYPKASGGKRLGADSNPFGGQTTATGRSRLPGDPAPRRLSFGPGGDFRMSFPEWSPTTNSMLGVGDYGSRLGFLGLNDAGGSIVPLSTSQYDTAPGAYTGPAFPDYVSNGVTYEPNITPTGPAGYTITSGPDAGTRVDSLPGGAVLAGPSVSGIGAPSGGSWYDSPGGRSSAGPGGSPGFSVPGGINWAPGSPGGSLGNIGAMEGATYLRHLMKGFYTSPYIYGQIKGLGQSFGMGPHGYQSYQALHANEAYWGNVFRSRGYVFAPGSPSPTMGNLSGAGRPMTRTAHTGGLIGNARFPRLHSGGSMPGGSAGGRIRSGDVNVAAFLDQHALGKWISSRKGGRNVVFNMIRGDSIDLGMHR